VTGTLALTLAASFSVSSAHAHRAHGKHGRSVVVRINDRGPFVAGRVIDLSPAAAHAIGVNGLAPVSMRVVGL
jgi:rare lipoprotein A